MAHGVLASNTAHYSVPGLVGPAHPKPMHSQSSNHSMSASSRSSDGTQGTTASTLWPPPLPPTAPSTANGPVSPQATHDVVPFDNIMNSVADASSSLFQICVTLRQRLLGVPGFSESLEEEEQDADDDTDPVTLLWRTFRRGHPLMLLYNALRPNDEPITFPPGMREEKRQKAATFHFLRACIDDLKVPQEELFIVSDLYGDDTTGFVKVARVVNRALDALVSRGLIENVQPTASDFEEAGVKMKRTQRQYIVLELVKSERTYVQHLELLQKFKHLVEEKGVIPGDAVHDIFLNLNALLDFQRRFLIRVEQTNAFPEEEQNWGRLFLLYCEAFKVYEPYIANQKKCERTVIAEFPRLKEAGGNDHMRQMVESPSALHSFLMKPFQRLTKYPLLLDQLHKKGDLDDQRKEDLVNGINAATAVLARANEAVACQERQEAIQDLKLRVDEWKGHRIEGFGALLLYGTFTVVKSENLSNGKDGERQYHVYLFENILLCCKDIDSNKPKNKLSNKSHPDNKGKPKLQLKGRIFMQNVTDLVSLAKPGMPHHPLLIRSSERIFWKGDPSIENFIIRFTTEEMLRKWAQQIEAQRRIHRERSSASRHSGDSRSGGTSATEFSYMQNQPMPQNPYVDEEDDDDDADTVASMSALPSHTFPLNGFSDSRNSSTNSLRSRSTMGDGAASTRPHPPRLTSGTTGLPPLSLRTRELQQTAVSPGATDIGSYFSPTVESPVSSRTSSNSALYPFPRQQLPPQNGYFEEGHGSSRFTAPAVARNMTGTPSNGYGPPRAPAGRPGYPPSSGMHSSQQMPGPRNRSASSPDIHNGQRQLLRTGSQPPVPEVPAGYSNAGRNQTNPPNIANGVPGRGSPVASRIRQNSVQHDTSPTEYAYGSSQGSGMTPITRTITPVMSRGNTFSPPPLQHNSSSFSSNVDRSSTPPAQLKVRVHCPSASQTLTLVVSTTITYQTLKDRIDAKLQRSTNLTLGDRASRDGPEKIPVKLKYLDEDDFVSIQSDEDVQTAFETWREQKGEGMGGMGEIELFCQR